MDALRLKLIDGRPTVSVSAALADAGLVRAHSCGDGAACVAGWIGSIADGVSRLQSLLEEFLRTGTIASLPDGDYAAIFLGPEHVLLMRDAQGRVPLFVKESGGQVHEVATSARCLGQTAPLDRRYMCRYLTGHASQQHSVLTPFVGVRRVLPGEVLELSYRGKLRSHAVSWNRERPSSAALHEARGETAHRSVRRALERAVAMRLGETTACHISGGTDSTSVGLLAARRSARAPADKTRNIVLLAATFKQGELAREQACIREAMAAVCKLLPSAKPMFVDASNVADFDNFLHEAATTDEPYAHAFRAPLWTALNRAAAAAGCDSLLTGCGADPIVDANPFLLHALARRGRPRQLLAEARRWAGNGKGLRQVLVESVVQPTMPLAYERVRSLTRQGPMLDRLGTFLRPPWLRADFAREHGYGEASRQESAAVYGRQPEATLYRAANFIAAPDPLSWARAARDGLLMSHPFLDRDLALTMRHLPAAAVSEPARPKAILRDAMADLLPPTIYTRTSKVPFNELYVRGLRLHGNDLIDVCRSAKHPLVAEIFDIDTLCRAVGEAALGAGTSVAWDRVNASLALVVWLEQLEAAPVRLEAQRRFLVERVDEHFA